MSYSGKFSLVQNFAELHVSPSEEMFVVLIFAPSPVDHTHANRLHRIRRVIFFLIAKKKQQKGVVKCS
jgi:hypothetical protein